MDYGYREEYEQEIDMRDLFFHILYRWRSVLLIATAVGILVGVYAFTYNEVLLPKKTAEVREQLEEQKRRLGEMQQLQKQLQEQASGEVKEKPQDGSHQTAAQTQVKTTEQAKNEIEKLQKQIEELQKQTEELKERSVAKYTLIGFAMGFFVMVFYYGTVYAFSDKLRGERELRERYGYYLLGTFPRQRKGKPLSGMDRFLEGKEGITGKLTREEACRIVAVNITNLAKDGGVFLVTGTVDTGRLQELTKAILPQLQENVALMIGADMNFTAATLEALAECDGVILVEERGKSLRGKIQKECESIVALEKRVVGYVVV